MAPPILIALGYLGAAVFYSPYIGINGQSVIACPVCPDVDAPGGGFLAFILLTGILGTVNAFYLVVPCLAFMAYKDWTDRIRQELPGWRAAIGLAAVALTLFGWLLMYPLAFLVGPWGPTAILFWEKSVVPTVCLGTISALTLRGKSRVYLVVAGIGMLGICRLLKGMSL